MLNIQNVSDNMLGISDNNNVSNSGAFETFFVSKALIKRSQLLTMLSAKDLQGKIWKNWVWWKMRITDCR